MSNNKISNLNKLRHSAAHLLAAAVLEIYPEAKISIGPAIENGFYYDIDFSDKKISEQDLNQIEKKMHQIVKDWSNFKKINTTSREAKKIFRNNPYKLELVDELEKNNQPITLYQSGKFIDLCAGPHIDNPQKKLKYFKLLSIAGAYWRGDEKNKMLTRIYGTAFFNQNDLNQYLWQLKEAKKRDHRILGKKLDLFVIDQNIGKGLPLFTPKGTIIKKLITDYEYQLEKEANFIHVSTPHIARTEIYKKTGHWQHYREVMYAPFGIDGEEYVLKPMNCPHHYMIFASKKRSYKDLPWRVAEAGTCYRYEKTGELSGLLRVRSLTIDDSHILMTEDQIEDEFKLCINLIKKMFNAFHLNDYYVRLSLADPSDAAKYISDPKTWKKAGEKLLKIIKDNNLNYITAKGEASFYGPKIDYIVKDSLGRQWQMSTLQLDLFMGKRLNLVYTDKDGKEKHPVILHRGLTGSLERTIGILIEHFAGAFPIWLSPIQVVILPISNDLQYYAEEINTILKENSLRSEINYENSSLSKKLRNAILQKIPYMIIIGKDEVNSFKKEKKYKISIRDRNNQEKKQVDLYQFIKEIKQQIEKFQ